MLCEKREKQSHRNLSYENAFTLVLGIACLHLKFVDGRGNSIQLISSPKPSLHAYKDVMDKQMFDGMVQTALYEVKAGSRSPGKLTCILLLFVSTF